MDSNQKMWFGASCCVFDARPNTATLGAVVVVHLWRLSFGNHIASWERG